MERINISFGDAPDGMHAVLVNGRPVDDLATLSFEEIVKVDTENGTRHGQEPTYNSKPGRDGHWNPRPQH